MDLNTLTIVEASEGLKKKQFSSEELTRACLDAIKAWEPKLHAFLTVTEESALTQAREADRRRKADENVSALTGIPFAVKDILATKGVRTTAASKMLEEYIPPYDATVIERLKREGIVILGKTNLDEFAHGASTENSAYGVTHNPWDTTRVAGGSSGGSAAAVAAGECIAALGSDTGGSIRQPASFCGVVGLKPTYGRVSRSGLLSMTSSTDVVGPIVKNVTDAAVVLQVIAGKDPLDATTVEKDVPNYASYLQNTNIKGLRIGVPKEYFTSALNPDVATVTRTALAHFESLGATLIDISLPHTEYAVPVYYITTPSEVSANLARYDGIRYGHSAISNHKSKILNLADVYTQSRAEGFGPEAKRRIMIGTYALSAGYYDAYYLQAAKVRTLLRRDFDEAFEKVDVIMTPVSPHPAFKIGEKISDPLQMYLEDIFLTAVSLAGNPAISLPCGFTNNLPVGLQIIGKHFDETQILGVSYQYEQSTTWAKQKPLP